MNVQVPASQLLGKEGEGVAALEACRDRAIGALCAEAVGAMAELNSATLEYSKTRKQFGSTIGTFQVLQHRMVDMFIAHQEALSLMQHLSLSLAANEPSRLAARFRRQVEDRLCRQVRRRPGGAAPWRHGHDRRIEYRPLLQADFLHQHPVRRSRVSCAAVCAARRGRLRRGKHDHRSSYRFHRPHRRRQGLSRRAQQHRRPDHGRPCDRGSGQACRHRAWRGRGRGDGLRHAAGHHGDERRPQGRDPRRPAGHGRRHHHRPAMRLRPAGDRGRRALGDASTASRSRSAAASSRSAWCRTST